MKSYLKFLSRNKLYTAIEAVGLIISIAFVLLIGNYVWQQYAIAYDNPVGKRVYGVGSQTFVALSWWDKAEFDAKLPEAEAVCRISSREDEAVIAVGDSKLGGSFVLVDKEFFEVFPNYALVEGSLDDFAIKGRCLVSESFARKIAADAPGAASLPGSAAPVLPGPAGHPVLGTPLRIVTEFNNEEYLVCGIFRDFQGGLMAPTDILLNAEFDPSYSDYEYRPFSTIGQYLTLIKVPEGTDRETLSTHITDICRANYNSLWVTEFPIYTLPELFFCDRQYIFRQGSKSVLQMLTVVVLLLLISAIFNYVNLNLALSGRRAKEMATRRLLGASQRSIVLKYIAESVAFTAVCFAFALLLAWAFLPVMNELLRNVSDIGNSWAYVPVALHFSAGTLAVYLLAVVLTGTLAGIAPALFASRYEPIDIVRGAFRRKSKMVFSKAFIVFQNVVSVVLIAFAILMEAQLSHMMSRPLNARSEGLYRLTYYVRSYSELEPLTDRLAQIPEVRRTAYGNGFPGQMNMGFNFRLPDGSSANTQLILCTPEYFDMLGLTVVEDFGTPLPGSVWMSRHLAGEIHLSDSTASFYSNSFNVNGAKSRYVGGVFEDIPTADASASNPALNSAIVVAPAEQIIYGNGLLIEVEGDEDAAAKAIMEAYREFVTEKTGTYVAPFTSGYIEEVLKEQLLPDKMALRLVELFMVLSVLISLLGLLAMSAYFSGENTKGIAVRKVFGSDVARETWRTVREYMLLVAVADAIGLPLGVWMAGRYLSRYAWRIEGYWWIFAAAAVVSILIAFASVLWQTLRAARTNPSSELKKE